MKTLVISPTYNEIKNINEFIKRVNTLNINIDILIIDDNSPDGTGEVVKEIQNKHTNLFLISRKEKLGLGTAYCEGFKWAIENCYDVVVQIDADLSHDPDDILRLMDELNTSDLVIGSRYINGVNVINWPMRRLLLSYFANLYARIIIGLSIKDLTGGFKCFKCDVLKRLDLSNIRSEGYSFQIEINFLSFMHGFQIKEIPIVFSDRTVGESKMNKSIIYEAIFIVPKLLLKRIFKRF